MALADTLNSSLECLGELAPVTFADFGAAMSKRLGTKAFKRPEQFGKSLFAALQRRHLARQADELIYLTGNGAIALYGDASWPDRKTV